MGRVRCAVIGVGHFGRHSVRLLSDFPGLELAAVVSRSAETLAELPSLPVSVQRTTNVGAVFSDPAIDAVIIATPTPTHAAFAAAALQASKHVLVEKPMTANLREAEELAEAVRVSGRVFMVGHQYLFNDHIVALKSAIRAGELGRVRAVFAEHLYHGPIRAGVGCFWETAVHEVAMLDFLFGLDGVRDVTAQRLDLTGSGFDDFTVATVLFANDPQATIVTSWCAPEKSRRFIVIGEAGSASFAEELMIFTEPPGALRDRYGPAPAECVRQPVKAAREPLANQIEHFLTCIRTGAEPLTGIEHGLRVIRLLDRVERAR
ncbi:Gfo/Idh/MocA family oxidoreductase [Candidatus Parcubacteria bacterium]|nr:Gfo/Idh/MocA family oxidoreductase [Candidatus Parcubacteria bacterium]